MSCDRSVVHRAFLSVTNSYWTLSARSTGGGLAETIQELVLNATSPRGDRYQLASAAESDTLTYVADMFTVLLNRPLSPDAVDVFEMFLQDELKRLLGES